MTKTVNTFLTLFGIILFITAFGYAQPKIPRESILESIPVRERLSILRLYSSDPIERAYAAINLGEMGAESAIPFLIAMLGDEASLRWMFTSGKIDSTSPGEEAAKALSRIGEPTIDYLVAALKDENYWVRKNAALGLGKLGYIKTAEFLIIALRDQKHLVRREAARALGIIKDPNAVGPLIIALKDWDYDVRYNIRWALKNITGKDFKEDPAEWQKWWEQNKEAFIKSSRNHGKTEKPGCEDECKKMFKKRELRKEVTVEECIRTLCK